MKMMPSVLLLGGLLMMSACGGPTSLHEIQRAKGGNLTIALLSADDSLHQGKDAITIEFRNGDQLVDVGNVRGQISMSMGGTPMLGAIDVTRSQTPGRYAASTEISMAGTWRMSIEWDGPAGKGATSFSVAAQ